MNYLLQYYIFFIIVSFIENYNLPKCQPLLGVSCIKLYIDTKIGISMVKFDTYWCWLVQIGTGYYRLVQVGTDLYTFDTVWYRLIVWYRCRLVHNGTDWYWLIRLQVSTTWCRLVLVGTG